jgi:hypothetical protein
VVYTPQQATCRTGTETVSRHHSNQSSSNNVKVPEMLPTRALPPRRTRRAAVGCLLTEGEAESFPLLSRLRQSSVGR